MLEIVLTREDANTEYALVAEWLVEDRSEVSAGQPVCVVETTKATVEVEAPGAGTIVQLYGEEVEVELGKTIAYVAETADELASIDARAEAKPAPKPAAGDRKATRKAVELAELHGDRSCVDRQARLHHREGRRGADRTAQGVGRRPPAAPPSRASRRRASRCLRRSSSMSPPARSTLHSSRLLDHEAFRALAPARQGRLRSATPVPGSATVSTSARARCVVAPRIVIEDGVRLGPRATSSARRSSRSASSRSSGPIWSSAAGARSSARESGAARSVRFGGGGHRDPWATLVVGDLAFVGDEAFVNVCRPVLIGREVFLTMRSIIVTHNIGHSVLEGFENRFAPVVLEDRSQVGLGAVLYAGARVGAESIVASNSYVVGDIPAGSFAIGVPAKATGSSSHKLSDARRRGPRTADRSTTSTSCSCSVGTPCRAIADDGFEVEGTRVDVHRELPRWCRRAGSRPRARRPRRRPRRRRRDRPPRAARPRTGGVVLDSVREFCRKRGIKLEPGPWSYPGGLV